jgi:hypothetical protein
MKLSSPRFRFLARIGVATAAISQTFGEICTSRGEWAGTILEPADGEQRQTDAKHTGGIHRTAGHRDTRRRAATRKSNMVRRGSTVRVRQRARQSAAHRCFLVQADWLVVERAVVWSR